MLSCEAENRQSVNSAIADGMDHLINQMHISESESPLYLGFVVDNTAEISAHHRYRQDIFLEPIHIHSLNMQFEYVQQ